MRSRRVFIHPWKIMLVSVTTSLLGGALVTAGALRARGRRGASRAVLAIGGGLGLLAIAVVPALQLSWQVVAGIFLAINVAGGLVYAGLLRDPSGADGARLEADDGARASVGEVAWNAAAGALLGLHVGVGVGALYALALDAWISTLFWSPLSSRVAVVGALMGFAIDCAFVGANLGGRFAARQRLRGPELAWVIVGALFGMVTFRLFATLVIALPAFQAHALRSQAAGAWPAVESLLIGVGLRVIWCVAAIWAGLMLLERLRASVGAQARYVGGVVVTAIATMVTVAVYAGRGGYDFLVIGGLFEKQDRGDLARPLYELGLTQRPDGAASAHLQYRLALVHHRLGDRAAARAAFAKVVTTYTQRRDLVERSQLFLTALDGAAPDASRHIIPGIATRTEFKSAYCMPNSLALVLQYWNVGLSARQVGADLTPLDVGTTVADASWYVHAHGLEQWLMPLATVDDLRGFVDRDIPILVYIPHHVLAVIGYDDALRSLVTYDVAQQDIWLDQPLGEFLPDWRGQLAVVGIVLPPERFATLPVEMQRNLERWTRAYLHHDLHEPYHHSADAADQERAFAHLAASVAAAPEFFFDAAHVLVRPLWRAQRAGLVDPAALAAAARTGLEFARYDFDDDESLRELALLNLEIQNYDALTRFLEMRSKEGSLVDHEDLTSLLGLLEYRAGDFETAAAHLGSLEGDQRFSLVLGDALERTRAVEAAIAEYRHVLERDADDEDDDDDDTKSRVSRWARHRYGLDSELLYGREAPSLANRARAIRRIAALSSSTNRPEQLVIPGRAYLDAFPWDADVQVRYAESVAAKLEAAPNLPADERDELVRQRERALGLAAAMTSRRP